MPMYLLSLLLLVAVLVAPVKPRERTISDLLPNGITLSTPLSSLGWEGPKIKDKLDELGAYVRDGKIIDRNDKEVVFFTMTIPGIRNDELSRRQWEELGKLQQKHTVVVLEQIFK